MYTTSVQIGLFLHEHSMNISTGSEENSTDVSALSVPFSNFDLKLVKT